MVTDRILYSPRNRFRILVLPPAEKMESGTFLIRISKLDSDIENVRSLENVHIVIPK